MDKAKLFIVKKCVCEIYEFKMRIEDKDFTGAFLNEACADALIEVIYEFDKDLALTLRSSLRNDTPKEYNEAWDMMFLNS